MVKKSWSESRLVSAVRAVQLFNEKDPFHTWGVGQRVYCLHCERAFVAEEVCYDEADGLLVCPNRGCDGSPMDWSPDPWF